MKKHNPHITKVQRSLATFLLAMVCCMYCGNTFFMHQHVIDNEVVWHSHPFTGAAHTKTVAHAIASINHALFTCDSFEPRLAPVAIVLARIVTPKVTKFITRIVACADLRAPPAYIFHI